MSSQVDPRLPDAGTATSRAADTLTLDQAPQQVKLTRRQARRARPMTTGRLVRRRVFRGVAGLLVVALAWFGVTFSGYLRDSAGEPISGVFAEWARDHGFGSVVALAEDFYYTHFDITPVGGTPTTSAVIAAPSPNASGPSASLSSSPGSSSSAAPTVVLPAHLAPPANMDSPAKPALADEGVWQPVGSPVEGIPAMYATRIRADSVHTSVLASMLWIDTKLVQAMYVPGYREPSLGPNPYGGALPKNLWPRVLANINGAFRLQDSQGGYYYQGQMIVPLVAGKASTVIYKDGSVKIGAWGSDVTMTPDVSVVRQNLDLLVDKGASRADSHFVWGFTTHGESYAWRSAIGQRADGSLVYIGSPGLSAANVADSLVRAGVVRAMVLDMNNYWVAGFYFTHDASRLPVCAKLDPNIAETCNRFLNPYKRDSFQFLAKQ